MMMSFLCQPSAVAPSSQASYVNLEPSSSNSHENCFIENNCDRCQPRLPSSDMNCPSMFLNGCRCTFRAVANQRCYSNDSSGSFVPTSGINPVSTKASSTSGAQCIADQIECARDDVETVGQVEAISVDQLASSLSQLSVSRSGASDAVRSKVGVVVDCRGFVAFNTNHVNCAFNASCGDRFARKRLMDGKVTIAELVSGGPETDMSTCDSRDRYRLLVSEAVADGSAIVAYDDNTTDVTSLPVTHPLRVLTEYLKKTGATIKFLSGGLQAFHTAYPMMCSKPFDPPSRPLLYSPTTPLVEMDVDSAEISEILPFLFIGNERDAASQTVLDRHGINHVLNVTAHIPLHFEDHTNMTCMRLPATDNGQQNLKQYFEDAITFMESVRCSGSRVLVHCQAGVSRSPTIVLAYLMARYNLPMMTAFSFVKSRRHIIAPNFNFMGQLMDFERRCVSGELQHCLRMDMPPATLNFVAAHDCNN